jgi:hypothetical protein
MQATWVRGRMVGEQSLAEGQESGAPATPTHSSPTQPTCDFKGLAHSIGHITRGIQCVRDRPPSCIGDSFSLLG